MLTHGPFATLKNLQDRDKASQNISGRHHRRQHVNAGFAFGHEIVERGVYRLSGACTDELCSFAAPHSRYSIPMTATETLPSLEPDTPMAQVLQRFPGAQRALFARYHIGGCSSCGFRPEETLAQVCARNEDVPVAQAIAHIQESHEKDATLMISPEALQNLKSQHGGVRLIDLRTREEHEAVKIPDSILLSQDLMNEAFQSWDKTQPVVLYDHTGSRSLDATAYFIGHGFSEARALEGGIDAYSRDIDPSLPRYRIEIED